jgi:hypothetical protein
LRCKWMFGAALRRPDMRGVEASHLPSQPVERIET